MPRDLRRLILLVATAAAIATPALAADKVVEARKVFPYLEPYLQLPPAERSRFTPAYYLHVGAQPLAAPVWLVEGERRMPLPLRADGRAIRLPTLAQLATDKLEVGIDPKLAVGVTMFIEPAMAPAMDMDARELAAAIAQAAVGERKLAGVLALAMPRLSNVGFVGVASGEVEFEGGRRAPLPLVKGVPTYTPAAMPGARRILLPKVPEKFDIG